MKFKPYPKYKPSGVEWVGDIPEHWEVKRLKAVVTQVDRKVEAKEDLKLRFIGMEDVEPWVGRLLENTTETVPMGMANAFKKGNILFGKLRPYLAKACIAESDGLCSTEFLVLESSALNKRFLLYTLLTEGMVKLIDSSTYGTKMPRASWDFIGNRPVLIPSCEEQVAIVRFLDERTKKVDVLIKRKQALIERLKEKRAALISRTVTKGLPPQAARAAGLLVNPKMKDSGIEWLGAVPDHWEVKRLKFSAVTVMGQSPSSEDYTDDPTEIPFLQGNAEFGKRYPSASLFCDAASKKITVGALLLSVRAPVGALNEADKPYAIGRGLCAIVENGRGLRKDFAWHALQLYRTELASKATGSTYEAVSADDVGNIKIILPSLSEQQAITEFLDHETGRIDELLKSVDKAIEQLQEYRSALITAAVAGKINVSEVHCAQQI